MNAGDRLTNAPRRSSSVQTDPPPAGELPPSSPASPPSVRPVNAIWISPEATSYSCLCESCLELVQMSGGSLLEAVRTASVRGRLPTDTDVGFVHCEAGHELVVRRVDRPPSLTRRDRRQLQLI
jgi:hypothetical protein